jgi:hypothetical protein
MEKEHYVLDAAAGADATTLRHAVLIDGAAGEVALERERSPLEPRPLPAYKRGRHDPGAR